MAAIDGVRLAYRCNALAGGICALCRGVMSRFLGGQVTIAGGLGPITGASDSRTAATPRQGTCCEHALSP